MSKLARSAYGLDSQSVGELWKARAACGSDPDLWFDEARRQEAAHVCKRHCPVRDECAADVARAIGLKKPPLGQVVAGLRYTDDGKPWPVPTKGFRCSRCPANQSPQPVYRPAAAGKPRPMSDTVLRRRAARNLDLLQRMARGDQTAEIAAALHLSTDTVKSHLRALYVELGAKDRAHAVALGYQRGLLKVNG